MKTHAETLAEIDTWMKETFSAEDEADSLIDMCRARGAKIKKGQHTEKVIRAAFVELITLIREKHGSG